MILLINWDKYTVSISFSILKCNRRRTKSKSISQQTSMSLLNRWFITLWKLSHLTLLLLLSIGLRPMLNSKRSHVTLILKRKKMKRSHNLKLEFRKRRPKENLGVDWLFQNRCLELSIKDRVSKCSKLLRHKKHRSS